MRRGSRIRRIRRRRRRRMRGRKRRSRRRRKATRKARRRRPRCQWGALLVQSMPIRRKCSAYIVFLRIKLRLGVRWLAAFEYHVLDHARA